VRAALAEDPRLPYADEIAVDVYDARLSDTRD
jgi:hypothetical protein